MVDQYLTAFYGRELEDENAGWEFVYSINNTPHNDREFCLHNHNDLYEIYLFLEGELEFHIEGSIYRAHPTTFSSPGPMKCTITSFYRPRATDGSWYSSR